MSNAASSETEWLLWLYSDTVGPVMSVGAVFLSLISFRNFDIADLRLKNEEEAS